MIPSVPLAAFFKLTTQDLQYYTFFLNHPWNRDFPNVSLVNLEKVLQGNLGTDRARECNFRVSESTQFENFTSRHQPWWSLGGFDVCICLFKKILHISLHEIFKFFIHIIVAFHLSRWAWPEKHSKFSNPYHIKTDLLIIQFVSFIQSHIFMREFDLALNEI